MSSGNPVSDMFQTGQISAQMIPAATVTAAMLASSASFVTTTTATKVADYTAAIGECVQVDASGGTVNVTLPAIAAGNKGQCVIVKNMKRTDDAIVVKSTGSDTIDASTGSTGIQPNMGGYGTAMFVSDGAGNWDVLAHQRNTFRKQITLTTAEANAGKTILPDLSVPKGAQVVIEGISASPGGATGWTATASSTKLTISDTAAVAAWDVTLVALAGNAVVLNGTSGSTEKQGAVAGLTADKGLTIRSDGTHDVNAGSTLTLNVWGRFV